MKLSVVIPAHNEAGSIAATLRGLADELRGDGIDEVLQEIYDVNVESWTAEAAAL